jgi:hypothetical protein
MAAQFLFFSLFLKCTVIGLFRHYVLLWQFFSTRNVAIACEGVMDILRDGDWHKIFYLCCLGSDPVTTAFQSASFDQKNPKRFSSEGGLCCFNSYRPRVPLSKVLIFPLMSSQALLRPPCHLCCQKLQNCLRS